LSDEAIAWSSEQNDAAMAENRHGRNTHSDYNHLVALVAPISATCSTLVINFANSDNPPSPAGDGRGWFQY
jgi:hypothetical protein